jgi:hypothetical protein
MKDGDETVVYNTLRRIPVTDMLIKYQSYKLSYNTHAGIGDRRLMAHATDLYRPREVMLHHGRLKLLEEHGWTFDDFIIAIEKNAIIEEVRLHNMNITFPTDLINRAKLFFPDLICHEARIEL